MEPGYLLAFTTGILGGFGHCIGMCGPLVASYTIHGKGFGRSGMPLSPHLLYNAGRITTYVFIGSVMGITGSFVNTAGRLTGIQEVVSVIAGLLMVFMGLSITGLAGGTNFIEKHNGFILKAVKVVLEGTSVWRYYPLGLLLGFLPCGLSYSIFLAAAGTGHMLHGMFLALCFGLGTVPALLLFGAVINYLSANVRGMVYKAGGVAVIAMGIYFIYRGSGLRLQ